ncbi:MAG: hypothetical protein ACI9WU_000872 [Myxococcota bacterium]|jgi:hypothetical protein
MDVQQLSVKLFAAAGAPLDQEELIPIFHRWIRESRLGDKLLIDVADYRHVPDGPGVMIVADHAHYGLDEGIGGGTGFLFSHRRDAIGDAAPKLADALSELLTAAEALEGEPSLKGFAFDTSRIQVRVASRRVAANTAEDFAKLAPTVTSAAQKLYGGEVTVTQGGLPRDPLTLEVSGPAGLSLAALRANL